MANLTLSIPVIRGKVVIKKLWFPSPKKFGTPLVGTQLILKLLRFFLVWQSFSCSQNLVFKVILLNMSIIIAPFIPVTIENSTCYISSATIGTLFLSRASCSFLCCVRVINHNTRALLLLVFCCFYAKWRVPVTNLTIQTQQEERMRKKNDKIDKSSKIERMSIMDCALHHFKHSRTLILQINYFQTTDYLHVQF